VSGERHEAQSAEHKAQGAGQEKKRKGNKKEYEERFKKR